MSAVRRSELLQASPFIHLIWNPWRAPADRFDSIVAAERSLLREREQGTVCSFFLVPRTPPSLSLFSTQHTLFQHPCTSTSLYSPSTVAAAERRHQPLSNLRSSFGCFASITMPFFTYTLAASLFMSLGGLLYGFDSGVISECLLNTRSIAVPRRRR